jgi:hypothetical protein
MMGVDYTDKSRKIHLRSKVKEYLLRHTDMSATFTSQDYPGKMFPIIRGCAKYMNNDILRPLGIPEWSKATTQHVIHSIFKDTRRNERSKPKAAAKRREKRELAAAVSPETKTPT